MKLHLGCGTKHLDGWINIDSVASCQPDLVHDLIEKFPYADQTVDEILAEDLLEHFDKYMRIQVFSEWARVLKVGGRVTVQVPNFKKILRRYFKFGYDNFVDFIFGENLWNSEIYIGHFGNHKWGYSVETLTEFVQLFGFQSLDVTTPGLNIRMTAEKIHHVTDDELDKISIHSHANKFGPGPADVTWKFAKDKVEQFKQGLNAESICNERG